MTRFSTLPAGEKRRNRTNEKLDNCLSFEAWLCEWATAGAEASSTRSQNRAVERSEVEIEACDSPIDAYAADGVVDYGYRDTS
jgi:hypothetical protein